MLDFAKRVYYCLSEKSVKSFHFPISNELEVLATDGEGQGFIIRYRAHYTMWHIVPTTSWSRTFKL